MAAAAPNANPVTLLAEPLYYGYPWIKGVHAQAHECMMPAEEFIERMSAIRTLHYANNEAAAIARTVGNLRGAAAEWWSTRFTMTVDDVDVNAITTRWDDFLAIFRKQWFVCRSRWEAANSYLSLRHDHSEPAWIYLERILAEYRRDQGYLRKELITPIGDIEFRHDGSAAMTAAHAEIVALGANAQALLRMYLRNCKDDCVNTTLTRQRDTDIMRALCAGVADNSIRQSLFKKSDSPMTYTQLSDFVRREEDSRRNARALQNNSTKPQGQRPQSHSGSQGQRAKTHAISDATTTAAEDSDTEDPSLSLNSEELAVVQAMREQRRRGRGGRNNRFNRSGQRFQRYQRQQEDDPPRDAQGRFAPRSTASSAVANAVNSTASDYQAFYQDAAEPTEVALNRPLI